MVNALFRDIPTRDTVLGWLKLIQIYDFHDSHTFTETSFPFEDFNRILIEAEPYYFPCKATLYLHRPMTMKRVMTILRQLVKPHGYTFLTHERLSNGQKYNEYYLIPESGTCEIEPPVIEFAPLTFN
jgi:hypothetical protein